MLSKRILWQNSHDLSMHLIIIHFNDVIAFHSSCMFGCVCVGRGYLWAEAGPASGQELPSIRLTSHPPLPSH